MRLPSPGLVALFCLGGLGLSGCVRKGQAPGAQSTERQSETEYDVARENFFHGEPRQALGHALRAIELDDENAKAHYFISAIYLSFCATSFESPDCRLPDAEKYARKAVAADEEFRDARNLLGQILILENRPRDAIVVLEPLTHDMAYAANHLAWGNLGWAQVLAGDVDRGIQSLQNSITQPNFCVGHYRLGLAYQRKGNLRESEESLSRALAVESPECQGLQDAWEARGQVRTRLGKTETARGDFERCREISTETKTGRACTRALKETLASLGAGMKK